MIRVLVVGQTPPPHHGQAIMIERLLRAQFTRVRMYHVRMAFSQTIGEVGRFRLHKMWHLLSVIARIVYHRVVHRTTVLYYPPGGPSRVPLYRDLIILLSTRWMFRYTIFHFHAGGMSELYPQLSRSLQWLMRRGLFGADAGIRVSRGAPDDTGVLQAKRQYVVHNGIEDPLDAVGESLYERYDLARATSAGNGRGKKASTNQQDRSTASTATYDRQALRILSMSMLCESKGLSVLIEAAGLLAAHSVPFSLEIAGQFQNDEYERELRKRIDELGISHAVKFLGCVSGDAKWQAFARAGVFCFPTFYEAETFGIVLVEAMSFSLPVVATRWRGVPEVVEDGVTGMLVDVHDPVALAARLEELQDNPALAFEFGRAGRRKFLNEFTSAKFAERMEQVFCETVAPGEARAVEEIVESVTSPSHCVSS